MDPASDVVRIGLSVEPEPALKRQASSTAVAPEPGEPTDSSDDLFDGMPRWTFLFGPATFGGPLFLPIAGILLLCGARQAAGIVALIPAVMLGMYWFFVLVIFGLPWLFQQARALWRTR